MDKPEQMRLTIVGPYDGELLQDFISGKPVSFQNHAGYKIYVGDAYEAFSSKQKKKLEPIAKQLEEQSANNLTLANRIRRIISNPKHRQQLYQD
ncbi:hypothetical protein [Limosilactobacillus sp.]|jgi:SAM-dependent MidA family methyltransferase|uniref:hypothetical protein n=1 Tax=Limosilactobacillus sp. TaxID=2773925 RepID=UPI0025BAAF61|nr:hypothetical protein [Limosilactobacillus sp.]MCH3922355.1 hypothetical protein [Limosilactobacillus sp.]MCH3929127.1 hypothetical protein [Limosilactobacillus sp.]